MSNEIIGKWQIDTSDIKSLQMFGNVSIEFKNNGELIYTINSDGKQQKMFMNYKIKNNILITDQPSSKHIEKTTFSISKDKLELIFNGIKSQYIRVI